MDTFWMCYVQSRGTAYKVHENYAEACKEAERLASLCENIGMNVYILEALAFCKTEINVKWEGVK